MKELFVNGTTLPQAYHAALLSLYRNGEWTDCTDDNRPSRALECSMTMSVEQPLAEPRVSRLYPGGFRELQQYVMELLDGLFDFKIGDGLVYTYHDRFVKQLPDVIELLRREPESRRAVIDIRDWQHDLYSDEPACLQNIQYFIRDNKLHCKVLMRSNDAVQATFMNAFAFTMLQQRVADALGLEIGSYTHRANSFHCYERSYPQLEGYVRGIGEKDEEELTFWYKDEFEDLMLDSIPEIMAVVDTLKREMRERGKEVRE